LNLIRHIPSAIVKDEQTTRHNTGIHVTEIPVNPFTGTASIDYKTAEQRGYIKLDLLNVGIYSQVRDEQHLEELMRREPPWHRIYESEFCQQLIHIGNHYNTLIAMPEAVNSVERMAMFLAIIRPAKRHLIGQTWDRVAETVWNRPADDEYYFKKAHGYAYAHLVIVHMNLLADLSDQGN
jgi:hypothetical protein